LIYSAELSKRACWKGSPAPTEPRDKEAAESGADRGGDLRCPIIVGHPKRLIPLNLVCAGLDAVTMPVGLNNVK